MASAMESYTKSASGLLTAIPSSICYLQLKSIMAPALVDQITYRIPSSLDITDRYANFAPRDFEKAVLARTRLGQVEYNFDISNYSPFFISEPGKKYATMLQMLQYPFSIGSIHIPVAKDRGSRTTVHDKPNIDPKYYQGQGGELDFQIMAAAQAFGHKVTAISPLDSRQVNFLVSWKTNQPLLSSLDIATQFICRRRTHTLPMLTFLVWTFVT
jgi:hypothetical protein